jgi:hypothetical protein
MKRPAKAAHNAKAGLTQATEIPMVQANSLSPIGISAVKVLARLAAKRAVQAKPRDQGVRISLFPHAELMRLAGEYLAAHPELYQLALERAKRMTGSPCALDQGLAQHSSCHRCCWRNVQITR